jgi:hypothetical protein
MACRASTFRYLPDNLIGNCVAPTVHIARIDRATLRQGVRCECWNEFVSGRCNGLFAI